MNMPLRKNILNIPQGPENIGYMQEKVQIGDFPKKTSKFEIFLLF